MAFLVASTQGAAELLRHPLSCSAVLAFAAVDAALHGRHKQLMHFALSLNRRNLRMWVGLLLTGHNA